MTLIKIILIYTTLLLVSCINAQAGNIRLILVEPGVGVYHLSIYGRLDQGTVEHFDIKNPTELSKFTSGFEGQAEIGLTGKTPCSYTIGFCDGDLTHDNYDVNGSYVSTTVDKVSGSLSFVDIRATTTASKTFSTVKIDPQVKGTKDAITAIKDLIATK